MDRVELREYAQHEFLDCKEAEILAKALLREMDALDSLIMASRLVEHQLTCQAFQHYLATCSEMPERKRCNVCCFIDKLHAIDSLRGGHDT